MFVCWRLCGDVNLSTQQDSYLACTK